ncbi:MAG TPA: non-homologous end-joining DNA ligase [Limnochordales bacterium]
MLATPIPAPFDSPTYAFEVKWDGIRCLSRLENGRARFFSRTGRDITNQFPELQDIGQAVNLRSAVLDGEICVFEAGAPSFHRVQRRNLLTSAAAIQRAAETYPAVYVVFDLLHTGGRDLLSVPWQARRAALESAWQGDTDHTALSRAVLARGRDLYAACVNRGLEGVVAKRVDSPYVPGRRTRYWLKVRREQELDCVIGGYAPRGALDFRSLALGLYRHPDGGELVYVGNVGTGFAAATRAEIMRRLLPLRTAVPPFAAAGMGPPPKGMQWVLPRLVARVGYFELTPAGQLRHPAFRGLRDDKEPRECVLPPVWTAAGLPEEP